jgi:hypothetical protein
MKKLKRPEGAKALLSSPLKSGSMKLILPTLQISQEFFKGISNEMVVPSLG